MRVGEGGMLKETGRFRAVGDDGRLYTVIERTMMIPHRPVSGPARELPGSIEYELDTREAVTPDGDGFKVVKTGVKLRRAD